MLPGSGVKIGTYLGQLMQISRKSKLLKSLGWTEGGILKSCPRFRELEIWLLRDWAEGQVCTDPWARTPISTNRIFLFLLFTFHGSVIKKNGIFYTANNFDFWSGRQRPPLRRLGNKNGEGSGGHQTKIITCRPDPPNNWFLLQF